MVDNLKEKLLALADKWRKEAKRLEAEMYLVSGSRYYSSMHPDEQREWNYLRDRSYSYLAFANELQKELEAL